MRALIFGNSGSGKSTLSQRLATSHNAAHLDLDTIAWDSNQPGVRLSVNESIEQMLAWINSHEDWILEGCYADLFSAVTSYADLMIFLNPGVESCQDNCRNRPWEPHKYDSKEDQDENLSMLLSWVADYQTRDDEFSLQAHRQLFDRFKGNKAEIKSNTEAADFSLENFKSKTLGSI